MATFNDIEGLGVNTALYGGVTVVDPDTSYTVSRLDRVVAISSAGGAGGTITLTPNENREGREVRIVMTAHDTGNYTTAGTPDLNAFDSARDSAHYMFVGGVWTLIGARDA